MNELPNSLDEVVRLMKREWRETTGTSDYLTALELQAIRLAAFGPVESRLAETGGANDDELVHHYLIEIREGYRQDSREECDGAQRSA
jgi:hypothetical protein